MLTQLQNRVWLFFHFIQDKLNSKGVLIYCELWAWFKKKKKKSTFSVVFNHLCVLEGESGFFLFPWKTISRLKKESTKSEQMDKISTLHHRNTRKYCFNYSWYSLLGQVDKLRLGFLLSLSPYFVVSLENELVLFLLVFLNFFFFAVW